MRLALLQQTLVTAALAFAAQAGVTDVLRDAPLRFEKAGSGFISRGPGYSFLITGREASIETGAARLVARLKGANTRARLEALEPLPGRSNYLLGDNPRAWRTGVRSYGRVLERNVYPGVDLVYYGDQRRLEFDFRVAPGSDPGRIRMTFSGARQMRVDESGDLVMSTVDGELRQHRPRVYQDAGGGRTEIAAAYRIAGGAVGFEIGRYDRRLPLVIDPVLTYATYLGGSRTDSAQSVALDSAGNIYVAGSTFSPNFPVSSGAAGAASQGGRDIFVTKYTPKGVMAYSTYIGGSGIDLIAGMAADKAGNVYLAASTDSTNLPRVNALQPNHRGGYIGLDAYVAKLDPSGAILYGTFLGGNDDDLASGIAVDSGGNAYVTGATASTNFPVSLTAYQKSNIGILNGFVTKINANGSAIAYSTYFGGRKSDIPGGIAVDASGNAYVVGDTASTDFPTSTGAFQTAHQGGTAMKTDLFVVKFNASGASLMFSTLLGGSGDETGLAIAVDSAGSAYVGGKTSSSVFPTTEGALQRDLSGPEDAVVAKLKPDGTGLVYSTLLGGTRQDGLWSIAVDAAGNAYLGGNTTSSNFPMVAAFQSQLVGDSDAYIVKLDPSGTKVLQSSYLGGSGNEGISGIALDSDGAVYVTGNSSSPNFPVTPSAAQPKYAGDNSDAFLARFDFAEATLAVTAAPDKLDFQGQVNGTIAAQRITIGCVQGASVGWSIETATAAGGAWLTVNQRSGSGPAVVQAAVNTANLQAGAYSGTITVTNAVTAAKILIRVSLTLVSPGGQIPQAGVVNAASFASGPVAPGELVTVFGSNIGPAALTGARVTGDGKLDTTLAETRLLFDGVAAPLIYVSAGQASAIVPYAVGGKASAQLQAEYKGLKSNTLDLPVAACAPAIFTANASGKGQAAAANQDYSPNSALNPAEAGSAVMFFATGEGRTEPQSVDGLIARDVFPKPVLPVSVRIGGMDAEVLYAGAAPGAVAGVLQVNVRVPTGVPAGDQPLALAVGQCSSPAGITVAVR